MIRKRLASPATLFFATVCFSLALMPGWHTTVQATPVVKLTALKINFEPPVTGKPKDSVGGASRNSGQCLQDSITNGSNLTALLPNTERGLTASSHPTFFVYVPKSTAKKAFFSLQDENGNEHYQVFFPIEVEDGIVKFDLPKEAKDLEVGKNYRWSFAILCDGMLRPDSPMVQGEIQRIEPDTALINKVKNAPPLERASIYASAGIWHDTLSTLATLRNQQPGDPNISDTWESLLTSQGLDKVANKPLAK